MFWFLTCLIYICCLGSINEVGNDIVDVIPKSLSASDNLIMLEPIKVTRLTIINQMTKFSN